MYFCYSFYTIFKTSQFVGSPTCGVCACCGGHSGPFCECPPDTKTEGGFSSEDGCRQVKTILDKNNVTRPRIGQVGTGNQFAAVNWATFETKKGLLLSKCQKVKNPNALLIAGL